MMENEPNGWISLKLGDICLVNPKLDKSTYEDNLLASFVPMPAVGAESGKIDVSQEKKIKEVKKGYTHFFKRDVLFAKITPCMENGKMAVVPTLKNNIGFGSTEFHVLRAFNCISEYYLYYFVSSKKFRIDAEHKMTGAVGQRRVPTSYLSNSLIPIPPLNEQHRIVTKIEELFSKIDKGVESLQKAKELLVLYRQSLLKHAFEGKLTEQWRKENPDKVIPADELLEQIKQARESRYQQQLEEWESAVKLWESEGKKGKKPSKPKKLTLFEFIPTDELNSFPVLPAGWTYTRLGYFIDSIDAGKSFKCNEKEPQNDEIGVAKVSAITWGEYNEAESKTCTDLNQVNKAFFIKKEDFLFSRANTIELVGAVVIVKDTTKKIMLSDKTLRINFLNLNKSYVLYYLRSKNGRKEIMYHSSGNQESMRNIGQDRIRSILIPICSNEESTFIVELLSQKLSAIDKQEQIIEQTLKQSATLKQSILKKAFSGQLVPQDPNDEPASVLLERIKAEKARAGCN
ncbi:MAG: restriction endonuclease subunit S [Oligoflexia bacterium]|nr:restriction endonuclease subunit S [Oligoflexia bacterium]